MGNCRDGCGCGGSAVYWPQKRNRQCAWTASKFAQYVKYLSSDAMEGRGPGQKGSDLAADYIAKQFESYGLKPAGDDGSYFPKVPMVGVKTLAADDVFLRAGWRRSVRR